MSKSSLQKLATMCWNATNFTTILFLYLLGQRTIAWKWEASNNLICPLRPCKLDHGLEIIMLATTPQQCEIVIIPNTIQWTNNIIRKLTLLPYPLQTTPCILQNFKENNQDLINPPSTIHKKLCLFITNNQPNLELLQLTFPYLPEALLTKSLKCLQHIPNFTHLVHMQNLPPITPQQNPHTTLTTNIITWNCGSLNTILLGLQSITNKNPQPAIVTIQGNQTNNI
jgi:hypothetical protein